MDRKAQPRRRCPYLYMLAEFAVRGDTREATIALAPVAGWAIKTPVTIVSSSAEALGPTDESSRPDSKALVLTKTVAWRRPQEGCTFAANPVR